jgi:hypothetical protein
MNHILSEENAAIFSALSQLADDERGPKTGPGKGTPGGNLQPPPRTGGPKKLPPPGTAQQLGPKGGVQLTPTIPPKGSGNQPPKNLPDIYEMNQPPRNTEKKISPVLLYGVGALALYLLFFNK